MYKCILGDIVRVMPGVLIKLTHAANVGLGFMNKVLTLEIYNKTINLSVIKFL